MCCGNEAVEFVIHDALFNRNTSLGFIFPDVFNGAIPHSIMALSAVSLHFMLDTYGSGVRRASAFSFDLYGGLYFDYMTKMKSLQGSEAAEFRVLCQGIYQRAL